MQSDNLPATMGTSINALSRPAPDGITVLAETAWRKTKPVLDQFGFLTRFTTGAAIQRTTADGLRRVMTAQVGAVVATEIAQHLAAQTAAQMVINAQSLHYEAKMRGFGTIALSDFIKQMMEIAAIHEEQIDVALASATRARAV